MDMFQADIGPQLEILLEVSIAMVLGGLVGIEREFANKPAGFRTHMLVAAAAALFVGLSDILVHSFEVGTPSGILRADPIRVVEAVVTGVAFLGAGTIFRHRQGEAIEGLTTAASLLLVSAIGVSVALDQLVLAACITVLVLIVLRVMMRLESPKRRKTRRASGE
ncbi:MAG: MgtC/SapB family protein [Gammaproteobacteria bacterium]